MHPLPPPSPLLALALALALAPVLGCGAAPSAGASVAEVVVSSPLESTEITVIDGDETPRVGDVYSVVQTIELSQLGAAQLATQPGAKQISIQSSERSAFRFETLGVRGDLVTRWRVTFLEMQSARTVNKRAASDPSELRLGVGYLVDLQPEPPSITYDDGQPVSAKERDAVLSAMPVGTFSRPQAKGGDGRSKGGAAPAAEHLVRLGDPMPWLHARIEKDFAFSKDGTRTEGHVREATLIGIREVNNKPCAVVRVRFEAMLRGPGENHTDLALAGEAMVRAEDGLTLALVVEGSVQSHHVTKAKTGEAMTMNLVGKTRMQYLRTWEKRGVPPAP